MTAAVTGAVPPLQRSLLIHNGAARRGAHGGVSHGQGHGHAELPAPSGAGDSRDEGTGGAGRRTERLVRCEM